MPRKTREERRAYFREWYRKNRKRWNAKVKARYKVKKIEILANAKLRYHGRYRDTKLAKVYGISKKEAQRWLAIIACEICGATDRRMNLDHDHNQPKGVMRGRLCSQCNRGLGLFQDNPERLEQAAKYLRERKPCA